MIALSYLVGSAIGVGADGDVCKQAPFGQYEGKTSPTFPDYVNPSSADYKSVGQEFSNVCESSSCNAGRPIYPLECSKSDNVVFWSGKDGSEEGTVMCKAATAAIDHQGGSMTYHRVAAPSTLTSPTTFPSCSPSSFYQSIGSDPFTAGPDDFYFKLGAAPPTGTPTRTPTALPTTLPTPSPLTEHPVTASPATFGPTLSPFTASPTRLPTTSPSTTAPTQQCVCGSLSRPHAKLTSWTWACSACSLTSRCLSRVSGACGPPQGSGGDCPPDMFDCRLRRGNTTGWVLESSDAQCHDGFTLGGVPDGETLQTSHCVLIGGVNGSCAWTKPAEVCEVETIILGRAVAGAMVGATAAGMGVAAAGGGGGGGGAFNAVGGTMMFVLFIDYMQYAGAQAMVGFLSLADSPALKSIYAASGWAAYIFPFFPIESEQVSSNDPFAAFILYAGGRPDLILEIVLLVVCILACAALAAGALMSYTMRDKRAARRTMRANLIRLFYFSTLPLLLACFYVLAAFRNGHRRVLASVVSVAILGIFAAIVRVISKHAETSPWRTRTTGRARAPSRVSTTMSLQKASAHMAENASWPTGDSLAAGVGADAAPRTGAKEADVDGWWPAVNSVLVADYKDKAWYFYMVDFSGKMALAMLVSLAVGHQRGQAAACLALYALGTAFFAREMPYTEVWRNKLYVLIGVAKVVGALCLVAAIEFKEHRAPLGALMAATHAVVVVLFAAFVVLWFMSKMKRWGTDRDQSESGAIRERMTRGLEMSGLSRRMRRRFDTKTLPEVTVTSTLGQISELGQTVETNAVTESEISTGQDNWTDRSSTPLKSGTLPPPPRRIGAPPPPPRRSGAPPPPPRRSDASPRASPPPPPPRADHAVV